jgi:hypothetical protein
MARRAELGKQLPPGLHVAGVNNRRWSVDLLILAV